MKDMFYNYDHNIDKKEYPEPVCFSDITEPPLSCNEVRFLKNIKGKTLGVKVKQNSKFTLYFTLDGIDTLYDQLEDAEFHFEVLGQNQRIVATTEVALSSRYAAVKLISSDKGPLTYGNYRLHLYMILDDIKYTLFAPNEGILSIE